MKSSGHFSELGSWYGTRIVAGGAVRSTKALTGYEVQGSDGRGGSLAGFRLARSDWKLAELIIDPSSDFAGKIIRIPVTKTVRISARENAEAQEVASRIDGVVSIRNHLQVESPDDLAYGDGWPYDGAYGGYYGWGYGGYAWPYFTQSPFAGLAAVGPQPYLSDAAIEKRIEFKFFWRPYVDRDDVKLSVHGAVATLTGSVGTWIGWGEAQKDALKGGATAVLNQLTIKPNHW